MGSNGLQYGLFRSEPHFWLLRQSSLDSPGPTTPRVHHQMHTRLAHYSAYRTCTRTNNRSCATQLSELHARQVHGEAQHQAGQQGLPPGTHLHYALFADILSLSLSLSLSLILFFFLFPLCSSASCSRWTRINASLAIRCAACLFLSSLLDNCIFVRVILKAQEEAYFKDDALPTSDVFEGLPISYSKVS